MSPLSLRYRRRSRYCCGRHRLAVAAVVVAGVVIVVSLVVSTSYTREYASEYEYSWEIPKWKLVLNSSTRLGRGYPCTSTSTSTTRLCASIR
jgi:hypothetical protein